MLELLSSRSVAQCLNISTRSASDVLRPSVRFASYSSSSVNFFSALRLALHQWYSVRGHVCIKFTASVRLFCIKFKVSIILFWVNVAPPVVLHINLIRLSTRRASMSTCLVFLQRIPQTMCNFLLRARHIHLSSTAINNSTSLRPSCCHSRQPCPYPCLPPVLSVTPSCNCAALALAPSTSYCSTPASAMRFSTWCSLELTALVAHLSHLLVHLSAALCWADCAVVTDGCRCCCRHRGGYRTNSTGEPRSATMRSGFCHLGHIQMAASTRAISRVSTAYNCDVRWERRCVMSTHHGLCSSALVHPFHMK